MPAAMLEHPLALRQLDCQSMSDSSTFIRTFKYRLYPSQSQETTLFRVLDACRNLYNMALAERKYGYQVEGRRVTLADTDALAKRYRKTFPYADQMFSQTAQSVVKRVDKAYQGFFRRVRAGEKAGYPRFKGRHRFNSFEFKQFGKSGAFLDGKRLKLFGIGRVRVRWHRPIPDDVKIKTVRILHKGGRWYACFVCDQRKSCKGKISKPEPLKKSGRVIGLDMGISAMLTTSDGEKVKNPAYYREAQVDLGRKQRKLARAKRGSNNRQKALRAVQKQQEHVANQRADFLHKLTYALVQGYDGVAVEDLSIGNMVRNKRLSKSILDSGWGLFKEQLTYKAESAGREIRFVNPAYTSKTCSNCGAAFEGLTLAHRWVECDCGLSLDRDHNAARNVLGRAGWVTSVNGNVAPLPPSDDEG